MSTPAGPVLGPCTAWASGSDVAACRGDTTASDFVLYDDVAVEASMVLFEATGRQFSGLCSATVRPCRSGCGCWSLWIPSDVAVPFGFGYWGGYGWGWSDGGTVCGCSPLSRVKLDGYPVRDITEVKIDGVVLDALDSNGNPNWRLDGWRWLVRLNDPVTGEVRRWPGCQNLALGDDQSGTFSVSYRYGNDPPPLGVSAAAELASELYNACGGGECQMPASVTRIVRQGVTIEKINSLAALIRQGASGIPLVDAFIAAYPMRGTRRPAVWTPDVQQFARRAGT